jgi:hypothetical protein
MLAMIASRHSVTSGKSARTESWFGTKAAPSDSAYCAAGRGRLCRAGGCVVDSIAPGSRPNRAAGTTEQWNVPFGVPLLPSSGTMTKSFVLICESNAM